MSKPVITTYLQLLSPSDHNPKTNDDPRFSVVKVGVPAPSFNKYFYVEVGRAWQWTERLAWSDADWLEYARSPNLHTFAAYYGGAPAGYYELRQEGEDVELAYFGLMPDFVGKKLGGALLSSAIENALSRFGCRAGVGTYLLARPPGGAGKLPGSRLHNLQNGHRILTTLLFLLDTGLARRYYRPQTSYRVARRPKGER